MSLAFITLTNDGYIYYTINCLESLKRINTPVFPTCYCVGDKSHLAISNAGYNSVLLADDNNNTKEFQVFRKGNWSNITFKKFEIIYENLRKFDYVLFTDGDIIFENPDIIKYLMDNIGNADILIQNDTMTDGDINQLCTGFMLVRSSSITRQFFNPIYSRKYTNIEGLDDQAYLNSVKFKLNFKLLPLDLFPNGQYFYANSQRLTPYMIHFNWCVGHVKKEKMLAYKKWFLPEQQLEQESQ